MIPAACGLELVTLLVVGLETSRSPLEKPAPLLEAPSTLSVAHPTTRQLFLAGVPSTSLEDQERRSWTRAQLWEVVRSAFEEELPKESETVATSLWQAETLVGVGAVDP